MSLKSTFLALKKSGTSCPNLGEGGGVNLDKIQKSSNFFFRETFPKNHLRIVLCSKREIEKSERESEGSALMLGSPLKVGKCRHILNQICFD